MGLFSAGESQHGQRKYKNLYDRKHYFRIYVIPDSESDDHDNDITGIHKMSANGSRRQTSCCFLDRQVPLMDALTTPFRVCNNNVIAG
jgi:hypothetical protein